MELSLEFVIACDRFVIIVNVQRRVVGGWLIGRGSSRWSSGSGSGSGGKRWRGWFGVRWRVTVVLKIRT